MTQTAENKPTKEQIDKALDEAYQKNKEHAYFRNGFRSGVDFGVTQQSAEIERLREALENAKHNAEQHMRFHANGNGYVEFIIDDITEALNPKNRGSMSYKNGDFKKWYCQKNKRNYFVLGYFGGGHIEFGRFKEVAEDYAKETGCDIDKVFIDEILSSRRFKHFKYVGDNSGKEQEPLPDAEVTENLFRWLHD